MHIKPQAHPVGASVETLRELHRRLTEGFIARLQDTEHPPKPSFMRVARLFLRDNGIRADRSASPDALAELLGTVQFPRATGE